MLLLSNVFRLGVKELRSLFSDPVLLTVILMAFSVGIYSSATGASMELHKAPIVIVDFDHSPLTARIVSAFYPPYFKRPRLVDLSELDRLLDEGKATFALVFPENFQRDVTAGRHPDVQLDIDATVVGQAFIGAGYIRNILTREIAAQEGHATQASPPIRLTSRVRFNPNLTGHWFGGVMEILNNITMFSIVLVGAAFIREREHGTLEHLLVMPLTALEIMLAKVWANGLVVLVVATLSMKLLIQLVLGVPIAGSIPLFMIGAAIYLFSTASIGIFVGTMARSMPQFGLLLILVVLPLQMLSGSSTPRESMPVLVQDIMMGAPTTHFVQMAQTILYRGGGLALIWPQLLAIAVIGGVFFFLAHLRFRRSVAQTQL